MLRHSKNKGFTLVELMVTTSIFVFITALLVAKFGTFNQGVLLTNLAYDVALTIRTAQTYGLSVQNKYVDSTNFEYAYGVYFDKDTTKNKQFILFADSYPTDILDKIYSNIESERVSTYNIKRGAKVIGFCTSEGCATVDSSTNRLDISFLRPNPDARICTNGESACGIGYAKIFLQAIDGSVRSVTVRQTGQVSIDE